MEFMGKIKVFAAAVSGALLLAGLGLCIFPQASAAVICCLFGALFIVAGAVRICGYFSKDLYRLAFQFDLAAGLLLILAGLFLVLFPERVYTALPVLTGIFVLIDSLLRLQTALDARRFGVRRWWIILALGICSAVLGALLLLRPFEGADMMMRLLGASLVAAAVQNLYVILTTVRVTRHREPPWEDRE